MENTIKHGDLNDGVQSSVFSLEMYQRDSVPLAVKRSWTLTKCRERIP